MPIVSRGFGSPAPNSELVHWDELFPIISGRGKWSGCNFFFRKNGVGINADIFILNLSWNPEYNAEELARR